MNTSICCIGCILLFVDRFYSIYVLPQWNENNLLIELIVYFLSPKRAYALHAGLFVFVINITRNVSIKLLLLVETNYKL